MAKKTLDAAAKKWEASKEQIVAGVKKGLTAAKDKGGKWLDKWCDFVGISKETCKERYAGTDTKFNTAMTGVDVDAAVTKASTNIKAARYSEGVRRTPGARERKRKK